MSRAATSAEAPTNTPLAKTFHDSTLRIRAAKRHPYVLTGQFERSDRLAHRWVDSDVPPRLGQLECG